MLRKLFLALLLFPAIACESGSAYSANGQAGAYGSVDLTRLQSDKPPPASNRDSDRYFNGNLGP